MTQTDKLFVQINGDSVLYPLSSYATEDRNGQFNITNNQTQLELKGNTWKKLDFGVNYTITTDTILEFDFQSTIEGEIHGLGFDNDNVLSTSWLFKLSGTQNVGLRDFDNYVTGSGWQTYQIPVGNFFTGDFQYFVLSNDHDVTSPTGNGQFRNLRIYENVAVLDIAPLDAVQAEGNTGTTPFTFTVTRSGDTTVTSTVNWAVTGTGDNPATADDFDLGVFPRGTLTFEPWDTTNYREITVYVNGDISYEADEGFSVTLSDAVDAIINTDTAEGIILNDDVPPTLDIAPLDAVQAEGNEGLTPFTFTVTRSGDTTATSTVNWAVTLSGTADAADFSLTPSINNSQRETTTPSRPYAPNSQSDTTTPSSPYAPNRLIVKFNPEVTSTQANEIKNSLGVLKTQNIRLTGAEIWQLSGTTSVETALSTYGRSQVFKYIEPDYIVTTAATIPNDPSFNLLWGLHNTGQTGGTPDVDIDAPEAWDIQTGNPDLVIGVIDTGVDYTHPDLVGNIWTNTGEIAGNGIDDDGNGYIDDIRGWDFAYNDNNPMDVQGHGTHVSGTIAGKGNNAVGVTGVAWNAKIMPLKFLDDTGSGWTSDAILAVDYATAQGVKLTNNSWGGGGYSQALYDAIAAAGDAGSLFIAAAGNESNNNDSSPSYPASYNLDNIISVASTTHTDGLSWFSNYGLTTVDLGAPGSDIYSTVPGNGYASYSGTSMASPHVAGAAALLWSENPTWTAEQVKDVLLQTVDPTETLNGITVSGGRLNVYNALLATTTTLPSGTVEFAPGETTKEITVYVSGDTDFEGDEGFSVTLSDATDAIINTDTAEGTILNDDAPPPTLDIAPLDAVQGEGDTGTTPFTFTVTRSGDTTGTSSVNWAVTLSGAADAADFSLIPAFINTADRLIVKLNPQSTTTQIDEIKNSLGVVKTQIINLPEVEIWQLPETTPIETALATYGNSRVFEYIESVSEVNWEIIGSGINPAGVDFSPTSSPTITPTTNASIINAIDTGWYDSTGWHDEGNTNYIVGETYDADGYFRNWIAFDLPTFTTPVTAAQLQIQTYVYSSNDSSETYELRDVTTPVSTLRAGGYGLTSIYNDLGDGTVYGSRDFSAGDSYTTVTIDLNSSLVNALNAKSGQQFALGGQITTLDGIDNTEFIFGFSFGNPGGDVQLLLTYGNPLPSGTVEFAPGETTKEITVYVSGDTD
ncbi:S8 family serine peptidase, partial [Anabaenopsis arnoldii]